MLELINQLLRISEFKGMSENIDIAKGKYELPLTIKKAWKKHKRWRS